MGRITFDDADTVAAFEADFSDAMAFHGLDESHRDIFRDHWAMNSHWHGRADVVENFARFAHMLKDAQDPESPLNRFGAARSSNPTPPTSPTVPPPPTLSDEARALYRKVEDLSFAEKVDWFIAFAKVTGDAEYTPPRPVARLEQATAEAQEEDRLAREVMCSHAISYVDAVELVRHTKELAAAKQGPEPTEVPWLDSRPLDAPPRPWSDEDWERDKRRAAAADVDLVFEEWKVGAERGQDLVGERAKEVRAQHVAELEAWGEKFVRGAQETEAKLRAEAIEAELDRQARGRLTSRGLSR